MTEQRNELIPHPTWRIYDSSKIQEYLTCPRKYFYRYILGWDIDEPNVHLVFGEAWHRAMETLLKEGYSNKSIKNSFDSFIHYYRQYYTEIQDATNFPKSPDSVVPALAEYVNTYKGVDDFDVLYTEIAGSVPISENRAIHFRMDSVLKDDTGVFSLEHKTGSRLGQAWTDSWQLKMQTGTYLHVLKCLYPDDEVYGIKINGVIFKRRSNDYIRVPIRKSEDMMDVWLWNINHQIDLIEWNVNEMLETSENDRIMPAFPMNTESCTNWGRTCKYFDFCNTWSNPLERADEPPLGFSVTYWNPEERHKDIEDVTDLIINKKE